MQLDLGPKSKFLKDDPIRLSRTRSDRIWMGLYLCFGSQKHKKSAVIEASSYQGDRKRRKIQVVFWTSLQTIVEESRCHFHLGRQMFKLT